MIHKKYKNKHFKERGKCIKETKVYWHFRKSVSIVKLCIHLQCTKNFYLIQAGSARKHPLPIDTQLSSMHKKMYELRYNALESLSTCFPVIRLSYKLY